MNYDDLPIKNDDFPMATLVITRGYIIYIYMEDPAADHFLSKAWLQ